MVRSPSKLALLAWLLGALAIWSCSSSQGPGSVEGVGGDASAADSAGVGGSLEIGGASAGSDATSAGMGGASAEMGGTSAGMGGTSAGMGGTSASMGGTSAGMGGNAFAGLTGSAGANVAEAGASPVSGIAGASAGGATSFAEGGAGGVSSESDAGGGAAGAAESGAGGSADSVSSFDGHCGQGWAAGGSAPLPTLAGSVTPEAVGAGDFSFEFGRYRLLVAGARGARIVEFSLDGSNLLDPIAGSTFFPSPQQAYAWPPPPELDSDPYVAQLDGSSLTLSSGTSTALGLSARKRFWVNAASGVVSIEYQLINQSNLSASWAPWEVTRVRAGGYTFAPRGPGNRSISEDPWQFPLPLRAINGIEWLNYPSLTLTEDNYLSEFDGAEGWLAHANHLGSSQLPVLFVKSFVDAPDASLPANQAEIQLWTSGTANPKLIEVEEQGAAKLLLPGASLTWTVRWSACELPSNLLFSAGSAELAALARAHAVVTY